MASVEVVTIGNEKKGQVDLPASIFEVEVKAHLLHAEVRRQLAARRRGTHSTKNRAAVSGGGAKPWKQKGTGRARQGTTRAPQWAGGGSVFGPVPRSYRQALPKKVRAAALRSALSSKAGTEGVVVVEDFAIEPRTKRAAEAFAALGLADAKVLLVLEDRNADVERATRNLARARTVPVQGLNVYDVLWADRVVITRAALEGIEARLAGKGNGA